MLWMARRPSRSRHSLAGAAAVDADEQREQVGVATVCLCDPVRRLRDGIRPASMARSTCASIEVMQAAASRAKSGCSEIGAHADVDPPTGGLEVSTLDRCRVAGQAQVVERLLGRPDRRARR